MKNRVLFYSSVRNKDLFRIQRFYHIDIELIKNIGFNIFESNRISDFLCFWKYDIAFIYFYRYGLFPAILSRLFLKKVYFTGGIDGLEESATSRRSYMLQKILFKLCYFFSNKCILVSLADEGNVKKIYKGMLPPKTTLSFHTIEVEQYDNEELYEKQNIFTTISWMENIENIYRKGVDKSLNVFKYLTEKTEYSEAIMYIIGKEGDGSNYLKKLCAAMNISDKVVFTGSIDEDRKIDILKRSKHYFQLSSYEGFGLAVLEAMAARNIIIHSGVGGLRDTVKDYGIKVDIKSDIRRQVDYIYRELLNYNLFQLDLAQKHVTNNYSNIRRESHFKKVFEVPYEKTN